MLIQAVTADDPPSSAAVHNTAILSPANGIHNLIDPSAYSNYTKLLDITAYVLRFTHNTRQKLFKLTGPLPPLNYPLPIFNGSVMYMQHRSFQEELSSLQSPDRSSRLPLVRQLRLYLDHTGLIRCGGRIHNAPLSESAKFPNFYHKRTHSPLSSSGTFISNNTMLG